MNSIFKSPHKRMGWSVLCIALLALLLSGCPGTVGNNNNEDKTPGENIDFSTLGAHFTYAINDTAILTWDESDYEDLAYYKISATERDSKKVAKTSDKINKGSTLEWTATGLSPMLYDFYIRGYNQSGKELFYSKIGINVYNGVLQSSRATVTDSGIKLSWSSVYGSIGFKKIEILRADAEDGDYTVIGSLTDFVSADNYLVDQFDFGKTYYFKLTAYDKNDKKVGTTEAFSVTTPELKAPEKVTGIKANTSYFDGFEITWDKNVYATSYKIQVSSTSTFDEADILYEKTVTEESYFISRDLREKADLYVRVCAVNEIGAGEYSKSINPYTFDTSSNITVSSEVTEQTQNSAKIVLQAKNSSSVLSFKKATIKYALLAEDGSTLVAFQDSNEFALTNLEFASTTTVKGQIKIVYYIGDSTDPTISYITSNNISVKTLGFPAPTQGEWSATKIGRSSITIKFPTLASSQLFGVSASDIVYHVSAYKEGYSFVAASEETAAGNTGPIVLDGLTPGTKYSFKVYAKKNESGAVAGDESEASELFQLKDALTQPVIKTIEETSPEEPYTHIKVTFDPIPEDTYEEIKYGIAWEIMGGTSLSNFSLKSAADVSDVSEIIEKVNGGNKYHVYLYAYEDEDGVSTIVRSEKTSIQLATIDDTNLAPLAGYYTSANGSANAGKMIDITNPATWQQDSILSTFTPRSTNSAYSWGFIPKLGDSSVNHEFIIKFGLTEEMREGSFANFKIYYVERYNPTTAKISGNTLAYGTTVYVASPVDGSILNTIEDYSDGSKQYDMFDMPQYNSSGTLTYSIDTPDRTGASLLYFKTYIFNNSIYFRVKIPGTYYSGLVDNTGTCIGFSYKY